MRRHDAIRDKLADLVRDAGEHADIEVDVTGAAADAKTGARMDIVFTSSRERFLVDVAVATPFAVGAQGRPGAAARLLAGVKRRKYCNARVTPAILEPWGRAGDDLQGLLRRIAPQEPEARSAFIASAWRSLSGVLQRHNALMVRTALG